jgi:CheY-like chemotaxis protein
MDEHQPLPRLHRRFSSEIAGQEQLRNMVRDLHSGIVRVRKNSDLQCIVVWSWSMSPRILLAGPSPRQLSPYADDLTRHGYEARAVSTGLDCLASWRDWQPDLMVLRPDMYWGSGLGVLGVMCEEKSGPIIPVVLLVDDPIRMRAQLRPDWHCHLLNQRCDPEQLTDMIDRLLHAPAAEQPEPTSTLKGDRPPCG